MSQTRYVYNDQGEITNVEPVVNQPDFRAYPVERLETDEGPVYVQLCCELVAGRWEYFVSNSCFGCKRPERLAAGCSGCCGPA